MPVETAADRAVFLSADDFGVTATYTPVAGGGSRAVSGIFDNDYLQADGEGEAAIASRAPRITCTTADLTNEGREGDVFAITSAPSQPELVGRSYRATVPRPDGTGMTLLWLERLP